MAIAVDRILGVRGRAILRCLEGIHGGRDEDGFASKSHDVECDHGFAGLSGLCAARCGEEVMSFYHCVLSQKKLWIMSTRPLTFGSDFFNYR